MKKIYTYLTVTVAVIAFGLSASAEISDSTSTKQDPNEMQFREEMKPLNTVLMEWDMVRGEWMAENLVNMAYKRPLTPKPFEENFTLAELVDFLPKKDKDRVQTIISQRISASSQNTPLRKTSSREWLIMQKTFGTVGCKPISGRTYGDPHINTLDGKSYSFQTVGEFVLSKSRTSTFEVQTRQKASSTSVSLNIAAAMNVNGDRVAFYTNEYPDANIYEPIRVNGRVEMVNSKPVTLNNGGIIRRTSGNSYVVVWPTGEKTMINIRNTGRFPFMDVSVEVPSCNENEYFGLLGNANGNSRDDLTIDSRDMGKVGFQNELEAILNGRITRDQRDQERLTQEYISTQFAAAYRINTLTSLFDYGIGQSTTSFTNFNFPTHFQSISDLNDRERNRARRRCEEQGVRGNDLRGCIFDIAFVNVGPTPRRDIPRATTGQTLSRITIGSGTSTNPRLRGANPNRNWGNNDGTNRTTGIRGNSSAEEKKPNNAVSPVREVITPSKSPTQKPNRPVVTSKKPRVINKPAVFEPSTSSRPNTNTKPVGSTVNRPSNIKKPVRSISNPSTPVKATHRPTGSELKPRETPIRSSGGVSQSRGISSKKSSGTISRPSSSSKPRGTISSPRTISRGGR